MIQLAVLLSSSFTQAGFENGFEVEMN